MQFVIILRHPKMGDAKGFLTMFVRKKKNRSGSISVIVAEKNRGKLKEIATIGIAKSEAELEPLMNQARSWIAERQERIHPTIDFEGRAEAAKQREREEVERVVSSIENVLLNGCELILDHVFDLVGFYHIPSPAAYFSVFSFCLVCYV